MGSVNKVAIIGAGAMGSQIAAVCALAGCDVRIQDINEQNFGNSMEEICKRLKRKVEKGKLSQQVLEDRFARLIFMPEIESAVADCDFVIEAVTENIETKRNIFQEMDQYAPKHAILATNSSTIVSSKIADATDRPEQVCNFHFFNPALVMELIEVVKGPHTSDKTAETAMEFARNLNKTPILLQKEISGFVANRMLGSLMDEALDLYERGVASHEEIDLACTKALNHPIGPFQLIDLTGIDVHYHVRMQRYEESGDESQKPAEAVRKKYEAGELGRKTGKGFYTYV
ncbi:3-hydroxyacyl-CoA dehydrogenase family protein [Salicibibacter cibi]|uniref:3-hydroxyacyl-CoA dehydrogenase family protein n=1 Tax=Salicibibacter cibi TaxID=2743001 RepID=A0A7T6ZBC0_9BACI|nr:3-hydroxyacyl-CoA dehydrogenase family protein [Salicibibacter cibi]QQK80271.1 3-hydroxyacyl-CoA dehydrogenase family protein [Salicibibacter cibi]